MTVTSTLLSRPVLSNRPLTSGLAAAALLALAPLGCGDDGGSADSSASSADPSSSSTTDGPPATEDTTAGEPDPGTTTDAATSETTAETTATETTGPAACESFELPGDDFFPEGSAYDPDGILYIASLATGAIVRGQPCEALEELVPAGGRCATRWA